MGTASWQVAGFTPHRQENRQIDDQGHDREQRPADGGHGECEPENLLRAVVQERHQAQHGRQDGEHDGNDLVVIRLQVEPDPMLVRNIGPVVLLVDQVDAGVDHNTAQQDESGEPALVEDEIRPAEREEHPDERDGDHQDDDDGFAQGFEDDGAHGIYYRDDQQYEPHLQLFLLLPEPGRRRIDPKTDGQNLLVELLDGTFDQPPPKFVRPDEIVPDQYLIRLPVAADGDARALFFDGSDRREFRLPRVDAYLGIGHMPAVETVAVTRFEHDLLEFLAIVNRRQPRSEKHRTEHPVIIGHVEPRGGDSFVVVADVEFVVGQRPCVAVHDLGIGDAAVPGQGIDQRVGIGRELVVIVAFEPELVRTVVVDDVVVERVVVDAPDRSRRRS